MTKTDDPVRLDAEGTRRHLPYGRLVDALRRAVVEHADGSIRCPERAVVPLRDGVVLLSMPAVADDLAIHKLITVAPRSRGSSQPAILGTVTVIDPSTGRIAMVLDGPTVTGRRTAALSMLALQALHRGPIHRALMIGTGAQAGHHVDAMAALFPDVALSIRGTSPASAAAFCTAHAGHPSVVEPDAGDADFDIVFTCTSSRTPVYAEAARAGRTIVAVGSFRPDVVEIAASTVRGSRLHVDDVRGAAHEAGDLIAAGVDWSFVRTLADALKRPAPPTGPVLFKSVGCAAWDLAAARTAIVCGG